MVLSSRAVTQQGHEMDLNYSADDERFRQEAREWLSGNAPKEPPPDLGRWIDHFWLQL